MEFLVLLVGAVGYVLFLLLRRAEGQSHSNTLEMFASELGWDYSPEAPILAHRGTGTPFDKGRDKTARHVLSGQYRGRSIDAYEYSYSTTDWWDAKNFSTTVAHSYLIVSVSTPSGGRWLEVSHRSIRKPSKIEGTVDLPLERDLGGGFRVRAEDGAFAYNVLSRTTVTMLRNDKRAKRFPLRFEQNTLTSWVSGGLDTQLVLDMLDYLCDFLDKVPVSAWKS